MNSSPNKTTPRWRKSSFSTGEGSGGECVELAPLSDGGVAVRDWASRLASSTT